MLTLVRTASLRAAATVVAVLALGIAATGCGEEDPRADPTAEPTASDHPTVEPSQDPGGLEQPALWPAADVTFDDPVEAAQDFLDTVLEAGEVGDFREGDSRSGEVDALFTGESGDRSIVRSTLVLRRLGANDGWFVIAASSPHAEITVPEALAEVPASTLSVEGVGRGFEGTLNVSARVAGAGGEPLDLQVAQGGAAEDAIPFTSTLDLSGTSPRDVVMVMVRGGTGLETDPGDFGAVPVVIGA